MAYAVHTVHLFVGAWLLLPLESGGRGTTFVGGAFLDRVLVNWDKRDSQGQWVSGRGTCSPSGEQTTHW